MTRNINCVRCDDKSLYTLANPKGVKVDRCLSCQGTWYDAGELEQTLGKDFDYNAFLGLMSPSKSELVCPCCSLEMTAMIFKYRGGQLIIDHCSKCRGFWLDNREYEVIKQLMMSYTRVPNKIGLTPASPYPLKEAASSLEHYQNLDYENSSDEESISVGMYFFSMFTSMPVEVYNPVRNSPTGLYIVIVTCIFVFLLQMSQILQGGVSQLVSFVNTHGFSVDALNSGRYWVVVTSIFMHANIPHIFTNLYALYVFGDNIHDLFNDHENVSGTFVFILFFVTTGIAGSLFSLLIILATRSSETYSIPAIGASGAVFAFMAAYWRAFPKTRIYQIIFFYPFKIPVWFYMLFWVGINILMALSMGVSARISWSAHLGGFAAGYFLLPLFLPFELGKIHAKKALHEHRPSPFQS